MISEDRLIAWLVVAEYEMQHGNEFDLPESVVDELLDRAWLEACTMEDGESQLVLSRAAKLQADIWSPEYGVELSFEPEAE